jgi:ADP-ribosylglycohydrolase
VKLSWINPVDIVEFELRQLEEEGRNIADLRASWLSRKGKETSIERLRQAAEEFLLDLGPLTEKTTAAAHEPSTLEQIKATWPASGTAIPYRMPPQSILHDRIAGGWYGRAAGCLLGKPVEKISREGIRELLRSNGSWPLTYYISQEGIPAHLLQKYPWNRHSGKESLRENIVCMPEDDDMNYPMLNLSVLESAGREFSTEQIAEAWMEMLPVLSTFTAERVAYRNCLDGVVPPATAIRKNPYREWIGAQIRGDVFGWVSPGTPGEAAHLAFKDARLSHVRNGLYGEIFVAATVAAASVVHTPQEAIEIGLSVVPPHSRLAEAVRFALSLPASEPTWEGALDRLYSRYGSYHWVHTVNNVALVVAALSYGGGEFERSVCNVVMGGWDTDSNGATVGSIMGTLLGRHNLPERWIAPMNNRIRSSLKGFDNSAIDQLAHRTALLLPI